MSAPLRPCSLFPLLLASAFLSGCVASGPKQTPATASDLTKVTDSDRLSVAHAFDNEGLGFGAIEQLTLLYDEKKDVNVGRAVAEGYSRLQEPERAAEILASLPEASLSSQIAFSLSKTRARYGDFSGAAEALRPLLVAGKIPEDQTLLTARTFILAGELDTVLPLFPAAVKESDWKILKGMALILNEKNAEAAQLLDSAQTATPDPFDLYLEGIAYLRSGKKQAATETFKKAISLEDAPADAVIEYCRQLAESGRSMEALALINKLPASERERPDFWEVAEIAERRRNNKIGADISRGYTLFYNGDPKKAEALWASLLRKSRSEDTRELYAALYNSAFRREDSAAALRWADEALRRFPGAPFFLKARGEVHLGQGQIPAALADAQALARSANQADQARANELLCRIGLDGGKPDLLKESAGRARTLRPEDIDPLLHLAEWEVKQGSTPEHNKAALEYYRQAENVDPKNADVVAHIGLLQVDLGDSEAGKKTLLRSLTMWPRVLDGVPHARLAQIYQKERRNPESAFHAKQYQRHRSKKERWPILLKGLRQDQPVEQWKELAELALYRRETWIARCAVHRALELSPEDPSLWRILAAIEKRQGRILAAPEAQVVAVKLARGGK